MRAIVLLLCLAGCADTDPAEVDGTPEDTPSDTTGEASDVPDDTDSDTDSDTDVDEDTDVPPDTDVPEDGFPTATQPCLFFHGMMSSSTSWTYRWVASNRLGGRSISTFEFDGTNHTATLKTDESWTQTTGGVNHTGTIYEYFVCNDDGLHITRRISDASTTIMGNTEVEHIETVYDTPALVRPNSLALGDSWTQHAVGTVTRSDGSPPQSINTTTTYTVTEDMVSFPSVQIAGLPSGGVMGLKIEGGGNTYWWSQGFGVLRNSVISELTLFSPGMP